MPSIIHDYSGPPVGGTLAASICGVHDQLAPFDAYLRLIGEAPSWTPSYRMKRGTALEALLANVYREVTGRNAIAPAKEYVHPERRYMSGHPDLIVADERIGVELKTAGADRRRQWGSPGTDNVPAGYLVQCAWYMALMGYEHWDIFAEIGGNDPVLYPIHRHASLEEAVIEQVEKFLVDHVIPRRPPAIGVSRFADDWIKAKYPRSGNELRTVEGAEHDIVRTLIRAKYARQAVEEEFEKAAREVKLLIGESAGVITLSGDRITYQNNRETQKIDWEAIARELKPSSELIAKHTKIVPGVRVLRIYPHSGGDE